MQHARVLHQSVLIASLAIGLDQGTKWLATARNVIELNPGGAFSVGMHTPIIATWVGIGAFVLLMLWWPKAPDEDKVLIACILGAGFSNLADRITLGGVRDFIALPGFSVFNVADLLLTVAAAWLAIGVLLRPPKW